MLNLRLLILDIYNDKINFFKLVAKYACGVYTFDFEWLPKV